MSNILIVLLIGGVLIFVAVRYLLAKNGARAEAGDIKAGDPAPDFTLQDFRGQEVKLSFYQGKEAVVLIFLRAFA